MFFEKMNSCCRLCAQCSIHRSLQKRAAGHSIRYFGDNFKSNKPKVLIRDTPARVVVSQSAPSYKYSEQFKEEALKNASDWLSRERAFQLFVESEEESYKANFDKYTSEYLECIRKIQGEITKHQNSFSDLSTSTVSTDCIDPSILLLNDQWNKEVQQLRDQFEVSSSLTVEENPPNCVTASEEIENTQDYISKLVDVKSQRILSIVTEESLDERIDAALKEPLHDFNFAVDNTGTIHKGTDFNRPRVREMNEMFTAGFSRALINDAPSFKDAANQLDFEDDETDNVLENEDVLHELGDIFAEKDT